MTKCPDPKFGEVVVMLLQGNGDDIAAAKVASEAFLPKFSRPKRYFVVPELPMTPNGKPARNLAASLAQQKSAE